MIVFLPIKIAPTGGTSSFAKKIQAGLRKHGHEVIFEYQKKYDVLLASPSAPLKYLLDAKHRHKKIIHRLDGVYYPTSVAGWLYPLHNARLALTRNFFADTIIYQSVYSQKSCERFLGKTSKPAVTIYNGVDTNHFSPQGSKVNLRDTPDQHVFITVSRFRRSDQIVPLIESFNKYQKTQHANSKLVIIGNFIGAVQDIPKQHANNPSLQFLNIVPNGQLPSYLRAADAFLFTHLNPPCPNNVLEAMACGLPICGIADGAMPELVTSGVHGELIPATSDGFYKTRVSNKTAFVQNMVRVIEKKNLFAANCVQRVQEEFNLEKMVKNYLNVLP